MEIERLKKNLLVPLSSLPPGTAFLLYDSLFMVVKTDPANNKITIVSLEDGSTAHWNRREEVLPVKAKVVFK